MTSRKRNNRFVSRCEGEGGVAGEGKVVGVPKFHFWGKCTMPLTKINSDWMSNASSGLCINFSYYFSTRVISFASLGVTTMSHFLARLFFFFFDSFCLAQLLEYTDLQH